MNRRILRLAIPNIISNITIPLLGLISIAIAGSIGSAVAIGAIGIGANIFGLIYWNCAFLRMGTSGMTAQAFGAHDLHECGNLLIRSLAVGLILAALLLIFQSPIGDFTMWLIGVHGEQKVMVEEYFYSRIWAAPATISLFAIQGWFIGMQNAKFPMYISIAINLISILFSYIFVYRFGMGIAGIGYCIVVAQYSGLAISLFLWLKYYGRMKKYIDLRESMRIKPMLRFFDINKDIFLRGFFNTAVYFCITKFSTSFGQDILAVNTILINLFTFFSYMLDGFGYAAEALVGRFIGGKNYTALRHAVRNMFWWCFGIAAGFVAIYLLFWHRTMSFFTDSQEIINTAGEYIVWIMLVPMVGFAPFLMDGILIGATKTRILRNSMMISAALFYAVYFITRDTLGNDGLWLAFIVFLVSRCITQLVMSDRLRILYIH